MKLRKAPGSKLAPRCGKAADSMQHSPSPDTTHWAANLLKMGGATGSNQPGDDFAQSPAANRSVHSRCQGSSPLHCCRIRA